MDPAQGSDMWNWVARKGLGGLPRVGCAWKWMCAWRDLEGSSRAGQGRGGWGFVFHGDKRVLSSWFDSQALCPFSHSWRCMDFSLVS